MPRRDGLKKFKGRTRAFRKQLGRRLQSQLDRQKAKQ